MAQINNRKTITIVMYAFIFTIGINIILAVILNLMNHNSKYLKFGIYITTTYFIIKLISLKFIKIEISDYFISIKYHYPLFFKTLPPVLELPLEELDSINVNTRKQYILIAKKYHNPKQVYYKFSLQYFNKKQMIELKNILNIHPTNYSHFNRFQDSNYTN